MPTSASVVPSSLSIPTSSASAVPSSLSIPTSSALGTSRASSLPASKPFGPPAPPAAPEVRCVNCGVNCTALWWKGENGENFCTSCGLYQQQHGTPRPVGSKSKSKSDSAPAALVAPAGVQCANCRVTQTPLWWKMANGENYCNSCRRYYKTVGADPLSLVARSTPLTCLFVQSSPETSPTESTKHDTTKTDLLPSAANRPKCCRCGTSQTLLRWMGFDDENYYCNSCSDYYKMVRYRISRVSGT
ncbi:hypothetical protein GGX14DRAFT_367892 [Mycena pura]|uniref:GATA-type domain-containing protein n=1 Tax=Mycena pura TaxID=153505 RepID=A0AAD6V830_9AGAR|nr:hypothetical protein GGX14DRAFT_367892 [Mycena pura]